MVRPVMVTIEDAHWADPTTARFIAALAGSRRLGPVASIVTYRSDELHRRHILLPVIEETIRAVRPVRLELQRLSRSEVGELCDRIGAGAIDDESLERLHRRTGGNPFLVEEVIGSGDPNSVSDTLRGILLARVATLEEAAMRVLQTVALGGELGRMPSLTSAGSRTGSSTPSSTPSSSRVSS
ncbi:MAG: hypothetical protein R2715_00340 [Ilumatobacteraceae bacterium]